MQSEYLHISTVPIIHANLPRRIHFSVAQQVRNKNRLEALLDPIIAFVIMGQEK